MTHLDLEKYIFDHIPIVKKNHFAIRTDSDLRVSVHGKLQEHYNHRNTAFGGSLGTTLTVAAWGYVRLLMEKLGLESVIVIQKQEIDFLKPVKKDFKAVSEEPDAENLSRFSDALNRFGKARLLVKAAVFQEEETEKLAIFQGEFVVVRKK